MENLAPSTITTTTTVAPHRRPVKDINRFPSDSLEFNFGDDYRPDAPREGLHDTPYKDNLSFTLTVEDVLAQNLCADPRVIVLIPTFFRHPNHRRCHIHISVDTLEKDGRYIYADITWHANQDVMHFIAPTVRINAKARLHIIVK